VRVAHHGREAVGRRAGQEHDVVTRQVGQGAGGLGTEQPRGSLVARQAEHGAGRRAGTRPGDPGQQVGLTLATLEPHRPQPLPRAVVALEELGVGEGGPSQEGQAALVVHDDQPHLDLVEEPAHLGGVEVVGQEQRHGAGHAGGELQLELSGAGRDADDHHLPRVDPRLDHPGGTVDDAAVELVPGERRPGPLAQLCHGDLERAVARVALQPDERRFVDWHGGLLWVTVDDGNLGDVRLPCSSIARSPVRGEPPSA
jgi:hypothetical protein